MKFNLIGSKKSSREGTQNYCTGQNVVNRTYFFLYFLRLELIGAGRPEGSFPRSKKLDPA